jgi:hypothetical protein
MSILENSNDWTGFEVITETGEFLGWVRNTILSSGNNIPVSLIISIFSITWIPKIFTGSYELSTSEICSFGTSRLIVFEGAEDRLVCQTVSLWERIGLVQPPWCQKDKEEVYPIRMKEDDYLIRMNGLWDDDEGSTGSSPVPVPRQPCPNPMNTEVNAPQD